MRLPCAGCCLTQAWQRSQLCVNMDKTLVDVLRSVRANSEEHVMELSEMHDILMSNRIRVRVFLVRAVCLVFSSCNKALPMLDHVEFADLVLPGGISAGARSMLEAVLAAHVPCARQDRRSRSPHRNRYVARENSEFGIPQRLKNPEVASGNKDFGIPLRLKNPEIPIGGPRAACDNLELEAMSDERRMQWLEDARVNAILGSCKYSLDSVQSGWRCFRAFAGEYICLFAAGFLALFVCVLHSESAQPGCKRLLPPSLSLLLAWSTLFRSQGTLSNYLGYVKTACVLSEESVEVKRACMTWIVALCFSR